MTADDVAEWDVFVSYTRADRGWAEWIAWQLEAAGWRMLIQAWDFVPGSNWGNLMQEGVLRAKRTLAVMSPAYLLSMYGTAEWEVAWAAGLLGQERKLIPVRVEECDRPGFLGQIVGADLFGIPENDARQRLLDTVRLAVAGRAKPTTAPAFPGGESATEPPPAFPPAR